MIINSINIYIKINILLLIIKIIICPIIMLIIRRIERDIIKNIILLNSIKLIIKISFMMVDFGVKFINKML